MGFSRTFVTSFRAPERFRQIAEPAPGRDGSSQGELAGILFITSREESVKAAGGAVARDIAFLGLFVPFREFN
jgi:hypothetical protein